MVDANTLLEKDRNVRHERRQVQIALDEQLARDEQSEEEETQVKSVPDKPSRASSFFFGEPTKYSYHNFWLLLACSYEENHGVYG
jgi:hypothetical protein